MSNNTFNNAEKRERKALDWFINLKDEHKLVEETSIGSYGYNDFIILSADTYIMGEIKIREIEHDKYQTAIIEMDKINNLINKNNDAHRLRSQQLYFFSFYPKDRTLLVFDVMNTPSTITYNYCNKTTSESNGEALWKPMVNYKITDAIIKINF